MKVEFEVKKINQRVVDKNTIRMADILFILGVGFLMLAHLITNAAIWSMTSPEHVGASVQQVAQAYEANPIAVGLIASTSGYSLMIQYVFLPAFLLTIYWLMRKQFVAAAPLVILFTGILVFSIGLFNALNDAGNLIGMLLAGGWI